MSILSPVCYTVAMTRRRRGLRRYWYVKIWYTLWEWLTGEGKRR